MWRAIYFTLPIMFLLASCSDYISEKREGLKPYKDDQTKQAEEERPNQRNQ